MSAFLDELTLSGRVLRRLGAALVAAGVALPVLVLALRAADERTAVPSDSCALPSAIHWEASAGLCPSTARCSARNLPCVAGSQKNAACAPKLATW